ncbi:MAG TPA: diguanylate cyclase [bacterium]|nr:diguanylate cyclase [bacterium]
MTAWVLVGVGMIGVLSLLLVDRNRKTKSLARANEELEAANRLRQTFADADTSFVYLKDEDLKYVFTNKAFRDFLDLSEDEISGREMAELIDARSAAVSTKTDLDVLKQGELIVTTVPLEGKLYQSTKFPVQMPTGGFGVGAYIRDVTGEHEQQRAQERRHKRSQLLVEVLSHTFASTQEQLDYALHELLEVTGSQYGYIYFYNEETEKFVLNSWTRGVMKECTVEGEPKVYQLANTGIWGEVVRQRKPIIVNDFQKAHPLKKGYPKGHVELEKFMSVPVIIDDEIVAVVGLANKKEDYNETDVHEMTVLMGGVWNAVQRRESTEMLAYERNKYYQTLLSIGDGVIVVDRNRKIEFINSMACQLMGWSLEEAQGRNYKEIVLLEPVSEGAAVEDPIEQVFLTGEAQELRDEAILVSKEGLHYRLEHSATPISAGDGAFAGVVFVFRDVTEKKAQLEKIEYMSFRDPLTGLYNRRFFEDELYRLDTEQNLPISILMGDVNSLKLTNDVFGHHCGDLLLQKVAGIMQDVCRSDDIIARWGGDEFVLLLPNTDFKAAERVAARIMEETSRHQVRAIECSISIGFDTKEDLAENISRTLDSAEAKMYSAKILEREHIQTRKLDAIMAMLDSSSERERRHAIFVSKMARRLGLALGLPESDLERLAKAGRLHDIGKVVMETGLLKRGFPLNLAEREQLEQHPVVSYRILNHFDETMELAEVVLAHHERWDGSGYPKGLRGEQIPLLARIIALVDAYDRALTGIGRGRGQSEQDAVELIKRGAGTKFDPKIVDAFVRIL